MILKLQECFEKWEGWQLPLYKDLVCLSWYWGFSDSESAGIGGSLGTFVSDFKVQASHSDAWSPVQREIKALLPASQAMLFLWNFYYTWTRDAKPLTWHLDSIFEWRRFLWQGYHAQSWGFSAKLHPPAELWKPLSELLQHRRASKTLTQRKGDAYIRHLEHDLDLWDTVVLL